MLFWFSLDFDLRFLVFVPNTAVKYAVTSSSVSAFVSAVFWVYSAGILLRNRHIVWSICLCISLMALLASASFVAIFWTRSSGFVHSGHERAFDFRCNTPVVEVLPCIIDTNTQTTACFRNRRQLVNLTSLRGVSGFDGM